MRIFVSYASEQRDDAERLALGLRNVGHHVFFDKESLTPGDSFDDRIRSAVQHSSLFIFLVSREALRKGSYSLSELRIAEKRWPQPASKILPILLDDTPLELLPPYLRAVSVLQPQGDLVADALDSVNRLSTERRTARTRVVALVGLTLVVTFLGWWIKSSGKNQSFASDVSFTPIEADQPGKHNVYRFQVTINNASTGRITVTDLNPETDNSKVYFTGSNNFYEFHPGEKRPIWADYELHNDSGVSSFKWRIRYGYVGSADLLLAKDLQGEEFEQFMEQYRKDGRTPWQVWKSKR